MRIEYRKLTLKDSEGLKNPFDQLDRWWQDALSANIYMLDAATLATVDNENNPDARIILLKSFDNKGLVFYTNYQSRKAEQLSINPHACLNIFWPKLERQIRVRGLVKKTTRRESKEYFRLRPRGAQIGAWSSPQSKTIPSRNDLEQSVAAFDQRFLSHEVPCPPDWGGFRLNPIYFEFWQGRENRLHDRLYYQKRRGGHWKIGRLAP
jgi:pyridoxamine 5'-phosphate oxidase